MLTAGRRARPGPAGRQVGQSGLSMVELLVGVAVGLLVVAGAAMLTATQLGDNRRLLLETQVQQDLRAAMDTITREVRRASARLPAEAFVGTSTADGVLPLPLIDVVTPLAGTASQLDYRYNRFGYPAGQAGFRLNGARVQMRLTSPTTWSDLTDSKALTVTGFTVEAKHQGDPPAAVPMPAVPEPQRIPCPNLCPDPAVGGPADRTSCWPVLKVRQLKVTVTAKAVSDAAVLRTLSTVVRPRNDQLVPGLPSPDICPPP